MESLINDCFKVESKSLDLNYSGTRELKAVVDSVYPTVKVTIQLVAVDHNCHVEMSKETFCKVMSHASSAISAMNSENETEIFENEYITVFTERMHNKCAVCFVDHRDVRVNMMLKTFKSMRDKSNEVLSYCRTIYNLINEKAAQFKIIIDLIFNKMEHCQLGDEEFKLFVNGIKQHIDTLCKLKPPREQSHGIDFGDDDFYSLSDDEDFKCYKCGCSCRTYR